MLKNAVPCPRCTADMRLELVMCADECISAAHHCLSCKYTLTENYMMTRKEARLTRMAFEKIITAKRIYATPLGDFHSESDDDL